MGTQSTWEGVLYHKEVRLKLREFTYKKERKVCGTRRRTDQFIWKFLLTICEKEKEKERKKERRKGRTKERKKKSRQERKKKERKERKEKERKKERFTRDFL